MTGIAFKVVVICPEAKKNIYLSIGMVHRSNIYEFILPLFS